jgi:hypothetical protein
MYLLTVKDLHFGAYDQKNNMLRIAGYIIKVVEIMTFIC